MSWGTPAWGWALALVALLAAVVVFAGRAHRRRMSAHFAPAVLDRVLPRSVRARRAARDVLAVAGLVAAVVALAEPRFGKEIVEIERKGVDIVLAVDLSRSMDAADVDPSRLERARREIFDLLDLLEGDRLGLVVYAGGAYPRMPLTLDHDAMRLLVREFDTSTFQTQGSELGVALRTALDLLDGSEETGKAIIVLSDGEVHRPEDALAAARDAQAAGVRVYALGVGIEESPIPTRDGGWLQHKGKTVLTTPSADVLRDVARITGGAYVQSVASADDVKHLYRDEIRRALEASLTGALQREVWKSGFQWPLGLALLCWLLAAWLGDGRRVFGGAALLLALSTSAQAGDLASGDAAYRAERYGEAVRIFTELAVENPSDAEVFERLGASRYRAGDFEGAARAFDAASRLRGGDAESEFNAGNAHYRAGRLEEALERYDGVLEQAPRHTGASQNKEMVLEELERRRQKQPKSDEKRQGDGQGSKSENPEAKPSASPSEGGESEGDQGKPSEGQPGEGEPKPGEQPEEAQGDAQQEQGEGADGGERDKEVGSGTVDPSEAQVKEDAQPGDAEGDQESQGGEGPVTEAQAERLLEGVEEGRPRIVVPGERGGKPW